MKLEVPRERLPEFLCGLPKAELHLHIEGTLEPEMLFALAKRNGVELPYPDEQALRAAYAFRDLQSFLDVYYAGANVLRTARDFHDLAWAYLSRAARENVVRAEIFFDPQTHTARGVSLAAVLEGLTLACEEARALGVSAALIMCFVRHLPEADALATLEEVMPFRDRIIGVGLDSSERGHPPEEFQAVFAHCRSLGLHRVVHAGEEGPAAYIRGALDALDAERIDHGVRCLEDPALVARLARERVPLTVCPFSNVRLRVFNRLEEHVLGRLLDAGLLATVNSDDPAYFGGYLNRNLVDSFEALRLDGDAAYRLAHNSLTAAFLEPSQRAPLLDRLEEYVAGFER